MSDDGKDLYFHANDVAPDSYAIDRYDVALAAKTLVFGEKGLWSVGDHRGKGADLHLLLVKATGSFSTEYAEYVPATKKFSPLLGAGEATEYDAAYAAQPGELLVRTNKFGDFRRLYRWKIGGDAAAKSFKEVLAPVGMDVSGFSIDPARRHVYAALNDGGYARLDVLDATTFAKIPLPLPKDADQVYAGGTTVDGRFVTLGVERAIPTRTPRR